jgi:hypothetical protein
MNRLLIGVILGMFALASAGWALAGRTNTNAASLTLTQRVAKLERQMRIQIRINRLNIAQFNNLSSRINALNISTHTAISFGTADSNGSAAATALCSSGKVVGGGAEFIGTKYVSDQIIYSIPSGNGWSAGADGPTAGRTLEVYAICASL